MKKGLLLMSLLLIILLSFSVSALTVSSSSIYPSSPLMTDNMYGYCSSDGSVNTTFSYEWFKDGVSQSSGSVGNWNKITWTYKPSWVNGLSKANSYNGIALYDMDGNGGDDALLTDNNCQFYPYSWNGTKWLTNNTIKSGIITGGQYCHPYIGDFNNNGTIELFMMNSYGLKVYEWSGSSWVRNTILENGTGDYGTTIGVSLYNIDNVGDMELFVGDDGLTKVFNWNGSSWVRNTTLENGFTDVGSLNYITVGDFDNNGVVDIFMGEQSKMTSYSWNGTKWILNSSLASDFVFDSESNFYSTPYFYNFDGDANLEVFSGQLSGYTRAFNYSLENNSYSPATSYNLDNISYSETIGGENWTFACRVNNYSDWSSWVNVSLDGLVRNYSVSNSSILPLDPTTSIDLQGFCTFDDSYSDSSTVYYRWFKDGVLNVSGSLAGQNNGSSININNLTSAYTSSGENWIFSCLVGNGTVNASSWMNSSSVEVRNWNVWNVSILPATTGVNDDLQGFCTSNESTGKNISFDYRWFKDGVLNVSGSLGLITDITWGDDPNNWNTGLTNIGNNENRFDVFDSNHDGGWDIIMGKDDGHFDGYSWNGTSWVLNMSLMNGLTDHGGYDTVEIYDIDGDGEWELLTGDGSFVGLLGYEWNGTKWIENTTLVSGIAINKNSATPSIYDINDDGTLDLIIGDISGYYHSYSWNGSGWTENSSLISGLVDVGHSSRPEIYDLNNDGIVDMFVGENGNFNSYSWNGSSWAVNNTNKLGVPNVYEATQNVNDLDGDGVPVLLNGKNSFTSYKFIGYYDGKINGTSYNVGNVSSSLTSLGDNWTLSCRAYDGTFYSSWVNSSVSTIQSSNAVPSVESVSILPATVYYNNSLLGYCNASDGDADNITYYFNWYKNTVLNSSGSYASSTHNITRNIANVSSSLTSPGDSWVLECIPYDGTVNGTAVNSSTKVISDHIPVISEVYFTPATPVAGSDMKAYCNASDSDLDTVGFYFTFYNNSVVFNSGYYAPTTQGITRNVGKVSGAYTVANDSWVLECIPYDGVYNGTSTNSSPFVVNSPAVVESVSILPATVYTGTAMQGYCNATDINSDNVTYYYSWYKNTVLNSSGSYASSTEGVSRNVANISGALTSESDSWILECVANDGFVNGSAVNSSAKVVQNSAPVSSVVSISPASPTVLQNLSGYCTVDDVDAENVTIYYSWFVNGSINVTGTYSSSAEGVSRNVGNISNNSTAIGDNWTLQCIGYDGTVNGTAVNSSNVTISDSNVAPVASGLSISPSTAYPQNDLSGHATFTSSSAGSVSYEYVWYKDGSSFISGSSTSNASTNVSSVLSVLNSVYVGSSSSYIFSARAYDGTAYGDWVNSSSVLIRPTLEGGSSSGGGSSSDGLVVTFNSSDDLAKLDCGLVIVPSLLKLNDSARDAEFFIQNNEDFVYQPSFSYNNTFGDGLSLDFLGASVSPGDNSSFVVRYLGSDASGNITSSSGYVFISSDRCKTVGVPLSVLITDPIDNSSFVNKITGSLVGVAGEDLSDGFQIKYIWVYLFFLLLVGAILYQWMDLRNGTLGNTVLYFFLVLLVPVFITFILRLFLQVVV